MKALTASEATAKLLTLGYSKDWNARNYIKDNDYTLPFGKTTFTYVNPRPNMFGPDILYWEAVGVRYNVEVYEDSKGRSNILLYRFEGDNGKAIANYNKMKAAEKKAFMEMLENATIIDFPAPQRERDGFRDASYKDENGVSHTAWYDRDGNFCTSADREKYLNFYPGEHYEYTAAPVVRK